MDVVHAGFDGLKVTVETTIPDDLAAALSLAKLQAASRNDPVPISYGGVDLQVRKSCGASAFSVSTGDYGAEWYLLDPHNKPKNNPGVTVDFRAFLLATGGVQAARTMFEAHMAALGIRWEAHLVKVSRLDFAVDLLASGFEPVRRQIVAPAGTRCRRTPMRRAGDATRHQSLAISERVGELGGALTPTESPQVRNAIPVE
jgi:hypothetical protein